MIRLLDGKNLSRLEALTGESYCECRIRAMAGVYDSRHEWVRFYADDGNRTFLCFERGFAVLFCRNSLPDPDTEGLLSATATAVLSEIPLSLPGFAEERGTVFRHTGIPAVRLEGVSSEIAEAYKILSRVFPDEVNEGCFPEWYADFSHRVRHGMSKVYTLPGKCTATLYCQENGVLFLSQIATLEKYRRQGLAKSLMGHIVAKNGTVLPVVLMSRSRESNAFYDHMGFIRVGSFYYYRRK